MSAPARSGARIVASVALCLAGLSFACGPDPSVDRAGPPATAPRSVAEGGSPSQVPTWSAEDLDFFLHGSMSTEVVPETVLRAFIRTYPDLFPTADLAHLGLIPDPAFGWPIGFSRRNVAHLGGLPAVGVNCASCHVAEIVPAEGATPVRVLGATAHFDAEAYFGSVLVATLRTTEPQNMKRFLSVYLAASDPAGGDAAQAALDTEWQKQDRGIAAAMAADPAGARGIAAGQLHPIDGAALRLDAAQLASGTDLAALSTSFLRLFHNMRAALHLPDAPPTAVPPLSGPGRNDAFGLLSAGLFGVPQPWAPVKYGLLFGLEHRPWVHWDGNTRSPIGRNLLASLGLGAPLVGKRGQLDFASVARHTALSERILAPRYPFAVDAAAADRGAAHYQARCASCHEGSTAEDHLYAAAEVGTDPLRAELFTPASAQRLNEFLAALEADGYHAAAEPGLRSTQKYWAANLAGVWARSPYLHNGSVRTMRELLTAPSERPRSFQRGSRVYDATMLGYADAGAYRVDTTVAGSANSGHDYGTDLAPAEKLELIEYLKRL